MSFICQHLHSFFVGQLYDAPQVRADSIVGGVIYQNRYSIRIFFNRFFHLMNIHSKRNSQISVYFRIYINRNCPAKYQGINSAFMYISWQNDLISCFTD